jgi:hypothetical protein
MTKKPTFTELVAATIGDLSEEDNPFNLPEKEWNEYLRKFDQWLLTGINADKIKEESHAGEKTKKALSKTK